MWRAGSSAIDPKTLEFPPADRPGRKKRGSSLQTAEQQQSPGAQAHYRIPLVWIGSRALMERRRKNRRWRTQGRL